MNISDRIFGPFNCGLIRRHAGMTTIQHLKPVITEHQLDGRAARKRRKWSEEGIATAHRPGAPIVNIKD